MNMALAIPNLSQKGSEPDLIKKSRITMDTK
jgi:hypothetical protein